MTEPELHRLAEILVDLLAERGLAVRLELSRVLSADDVARHLGRDRRWVYDHAAELGAFRFGDGPRARLGFDLDAVERWKRGREIAPVPSRAKRRSNAHRAPLIPYDRRDAPA